MSNTLFRKQVLDAHRNRLKGDILMLPNITHSVLAAALVVWVILVFIWLSFSQYSKKETAYGWLEPPGGLIRIYAEEQGIIKNIHVQAGDHVDENDILMEVNVDRTLNDGNKVSKSLLKEYNFEKSLIEEQLLHTNNVLKSRQSSINQQILSSENKIALLEKQLSTLDERLELVTIQLLRYGSLKDKGYFSAIDYDNIEIQKLNIVSQKQAVKIDIRTQTEKVNQLKLERDIFPSEKKTIISGLEQQLIEIERNITHAKSQTGYTILASRPGTIANVQAKIGQRTLDRSGVPLLTIIPSNEPLTAQLLLPINSVGEIKPNQEIDIRFDAFPYQKFGIHKGVIKSISNTMLLPNEIPDSPVPVSTPVFRIGAELEASFILTEQSEIQLKPGMTFLADIRLRKQSLIQWIFEPIQSLKSKMQ